MILQALTIGIILFLVVIIYPIKGCYYYAILKKNHINKLELYRNLILGTLLPSLIIIVSIPFSGMHFNEIGLRGIDVHASKLSGWIIYPAISFCLVYLAYNIYSVIIVTVSKKSRLQAAIRIPKEIKAFLPVTRNERNAWILVALNAGITEELLYRGFLFYAIAFIFPDVSLPVILGISTVVFGVGHIYQGIEVIKPTIIGLFFGFFYIVFDSILPVMLIHFIQDLVVWNLLREDVSSNNAIQ